jgi:peptidoglycan/xylan/chitin deacetylase (PgdA/CDA1 family)
MLTPTTSFDAVGQRTLSGQARAAAAPQAPQRRKPFRAFIAAALLVAAPVRAAGEADAATVPILLYHRLAPTVVDSMTVSITVFESQLAYLKENGYGVIPLQRLLAYLRGTAPPPPPRSVVITADDGHRSVYERMLPLLKKYGYPATLFIYPSAISNADYALTWAQLRDLKATGLFDIQSHTYWHPNFIKEKRTLAPEAYAKLVDSQLIRSREKLERETGGEITLLAWTFGLYDGDLMKRASELGYRAAFTIERRHARLGDDLMALPRYLITDLDSGERFGRLLAGPAASQTQRR